MSPLSALKGITGEFEINRMIGAVGSAVYIAGANGFEAWQVIAKGQPFDLTTYCMAFPAGLAALIGSIAGAVAIKDRNVAAAKVTDPQVVGPTNA